MKFHIRVEKNDLFSTMKTKLHRVLLTLQTKIIQLN